MQSTLSPEQPLPASPPRWRDLLGLTLLFGVVILVGLAFLWPWLTRVTPGGAALDRYMPLRQGNAQLLVRYNPDGTVRQWESLNQVVLPGTRSVTFELSQGTRDALESLFLREGESDLSFDDLIARLNNAELVQTRYRTLDASGQLTDTMSLSVRDASGDYLVSSYNYATAQEVLWTPPLLTAPSDFSAGSWRSEGTIGALGYEWSRRVLESGPYESALGRFQDCLRFESRHTLSNGEQTFPTMWREWYCAGVGLVAEEEFDGGDEMTSRSALVSSSTLWPAPDSLPAPLLSEAPDNSPDDAAWALSRLGGLDPNGLSLRSTIPPVWIPTEPPALLVAGYDGDVVALDASALDGSARWRFRTDGTVYSPPTYDAARERLYFGSSDKRLYALDARGIFLWSFKTGDNVASRPLVVDNLVIFGSEDRNVYAVDAESGALRWKVETGGAVVSSAALVGGTVVIGSDDGAAYGLDPRTGEQRWLYVTGGAVEAPIAGADGVAYVASRDGTLSAVDGASGEALWVRRVGGAGNILRNAPAIGESQVWVVDDFDRLTALDRATGRQLWRGTEEIYTGTPLVVGESLLVAGESGTIHQLAFDGTEEARWSVADALGADDTPGGFDFGPAVGGGAAWLADDAGIVRRLGPAQTEVAALSPLWFVSATEPPFDFSSYMAVVEYQDSLVTMMLDRTLYLMDPQTGDTTPITQFEGEGLAVVPPVISGNTLVVPGGDTLSAINLPDGGPLWQFQGEGVSYQPATIAGDTVLWMTEQEAGGTLYTLDLETGEPRWEQPLQGLGAVGGALVQDETVYVSTPPAAFDLQTGDPLWQAEVEGWAVGGAALNEAGDTFFVGLLEGESSESSDGGAVVALDTSNGEVRWRATLEAEALNFLERLWLSGDTVIVLSISGKRPIIALDAATGEERWRYDPPVPRYGGITVADGQVWLMLETGQLLAFDAASGQVVARFTGLELTLSTLGYNFAERPSVIQGTVYAPMVNLLIAFERSQ
ncbi:MAG TPA: PQQ-binding-like beta-propeller repeat protein [Ardenticatenaceae bacterium]